MNLQRIDDMNPFDQAGIYLVQTLGSLYILIVLLRFLLQLSGANFYNPISQFLVKATHLPSKPIRMVLPTYKSFDLASLTLALLVKLIVTLITAGISGGGFSPAPLLIWSVLSIVSLILEIYFYGLIAAIIISWVAPHSNHPAVSLLQQLMEPVMAPFRKIIPPLGGIDLSPIFLILVINLIRIFINYAGAALL
jgi:YggT family protein